MDIHVVEQAKPRDTKRFSLSETFGVSFPRELPEEHTSILGFATPGPLTPAIDEHYVFNKDHLLSFLLAIKLKDSTYIVGHSGVGKSSFIAQVAARLNYNLVRINFDGNTRSSDLIGAVRAKDGATYFAHGPLIQAFNLPGTFLLLDEVDACPPEAAFSMQRALEDDHKVQVRETGELFTLHSQNAIIATANTTGMGDESGMYAAGTNVQNFSFLNRFGTILHFEYMPAAQEAQLLSRMFKAFAEKNAKVITNVTEVAEATRKQFAAGTLSVPLTHRDTINWLRKMTVMPLPLKAAEISFLNRMLPTEAVSLAKLISSKFTPNPADRTRFLTATHA